MGTKKGATSATKQPRNLNDLQETSRKPEKTAAPKTYKKLGDAFIAFDNGELPRGTKLVIGEAGTSVVAPSRKGAPSNVLCHFDGTPTALAAALLRQVIKTKLKIEVLGSTQANPPASATGE